MCLFSDICCHVVLLHYTIKTRNSDTRFGQAKWMHSLDCRSAVRLVTVVWNILWTFCVSLRTAAGSSDTWGYTWRRHSSDCAHKGSKGHWTFKIFQALLLHGDVRSNMADASFICFVLWTTGTTWSYDRLVSFLLLHFFLLRHPFFLLSSCFLILPTSFEFLSWYCFFDSGVTFFFLLCPGTPHTCMDITVHTNSLSLCLSTTSAVKRGTALHFLNFETL